MHKSFICHSNSAIIGVYLIKNTYLELSSSSLGFFSVTIGTSVSSVKGSCSGCPKSASPSPFLNLGILEPIQPPIPPIWLFTFVNTSNLDCFVGLKKNLHLEIN